MKILILGGDGMLGHQLFKYLSPNHNVRVTLRQPFGAYLKYKIFTKEDAFTEIDIRSPDAIKSVLTEFRPEAVVNGIGIVKQRKIAQEAIPNIEINALFPHRLAELCRTLGVRLIHLSTDCVFSGNKGNYREVDPSDAEDLYGKSKFLGEVEGDNCLTIRTSIIGNELSRKTGLLEWFLSQKGPVKGYKNAIFSGFTTIEMSRILEMLIVEYPQASGIYHVSSQPINKYDLLNLIKTKMRLSLKIIPDETFKYDRSLNSERFRREFKYRPPSWDQMMDELCNDLLSTKA